MEKEAEAKQQNMIYIQKKRYFQTGMADSGGAVFDRCHGRDAAEKGRLSESEDDVSEPL